MENLKLKKESFIQTGIRFDNGTIKGETYRDWFPSPVISSQDTTFHYFIRAHSFTLKFSSLSWSAGYVCYTDQWTIKVNVGKSFRIPLAKELAANGVNYHQFSYEVGNPDLSPEISYQFDVGAEYNSKTLAIGITPFVNYFNNYIYLNPSWEYDRLYGNGNQIFHYTQAEVFRYGSEIHAHYKLSKTTQFGVLGEYVSSVQISGEKKDLHSLSPHQFRQS